MFKCIFNLPKTFLFKNLNALNSTSCSVTKRLSSSGSGESGDANYNPYPDYKSPSPYKDKKGIRKFYEYKLHSKGVLPRPPGEWEDVPLPMPRWDPATVNSWTPKKATFGQNDYIGDGTVHPWELISAPPWLKGFKGNELQRLIRRLGVQGEFLKDTFPTKYEQIRKQINYLYKKFNRRRRSIQWGGYRRFSRIDKPMA